MLHTDATSGRPLELCCWRWQEKELGRHLPTAVRKAQVLQAPWAAGRKGHGDPRSCSSQVSHTSVSQPGNDEQKSLLKQLTSAGCSQEGKGLGSDAFHTLDGESEALLPLGDTAGHIFWLKVQGDLAGSEGCWLLLKIFSSS